MKKVFQIPIDLKLFIKPYFQIWNCSVVNFKLIFRRIIHNPTKEYHFGWLFNNEEQKWLTDKHLKIWDKGRV